MEAFEFYTTRYSDGKRSIWLMSGERCRAIDFYRAGRAAGLNPVEIATTAKRVTVTLTPCQFDLVERLSPPELT